MVSTDESSSESASFATVVDSELCETCKETIVGTTVGVDFVVCHACRAELHLHCRGLCAKGKKPTAAVASLITMPWFAILCDECLRDGNDTDGSSGAVKALKAEVQGLRKGVESVLRIFAPGEAPEATKAARKSFASVAVTNVRPNSGFAEAVTQITRSSNNDELRQRSVVIDGVPLVPGECDREKILAFIEHCELSNFVRVQEVYRMGEASPLGHPPKIKCVFATRDMQRQMVDKAIRKHMERNTCPPAFQNAYINPSRTWEERRHLMKLRRRRNLLNEDLADERDFWFLDYKQKKLVKKVGGAPDWEGPGDEGWGDWEAEFERDNPPGRGRGGLGRHGEGGSGVEEPRGTGAGKPPSAPSGRPTLPKPPKQASQGNKPVKPTTAAPVGRKPSNSHRQPPAQGNS